MTPTLKEIQQKLRDLGFDPVYIDGIPGRLTTGAIERFQKSRGLSITGLADTPTVRALFGNSASAGDPTPPWITLARTKMGLHEVTNKKSLMDFLKLGKGTIGDPAKTAWCGDFVETCIAVSLPKEPMLANPYAAINWLKFGKSTTGRLGAILVFHRGDPKDWQGHVGFYVGEDATHYQVLGGNQSNSVCISRIAKNRLRPDGIRWPSTYDLTGGAIVNDGAGIRVETSVS